MSEHEDLIIDLTDKVASEAELRANRAYVAIQHCVEIGMDDEHVVTAARLMLRADA